MNPRIPTLSELTAPLNATGHRLITDFALILLGSSLCVSGPLNPMLQEAVDRHRRESEEDRRQRGADMVPEGGAQ